MKFIFLYLVSFCAVFSMQAFSHEEPVYYSYFVTSPDKIKKVLSINNVEYLTGKVSELTEQSKRYDVSYEVEADRVMSQFKLLVDTAELDLRER